MKIICTKCGSTHVSREAIINPNNKVFKNYTDESFLYGWCESCKTGTILTDQDEVKEQIQQKFDVFVYENGKEPHYAESHIVWKDTNDHYDVKIRLSNDTGEDNVFFFLLHLSRGIKIINNLWW